ncbi:hypothetical protein KIL84_010302, partial [Mauremys mutica]
VKCPAHIAHNTFKHASDQLSVDMEIIVLKIYSHFSVSTIRREELWYLSTRLFSLNPAVNQLFRNSPAITAYFKSLGESCPIALKNMFTEDGVDACIMETYILFFHNVACIFDELVRKLEESKLCITDVYAEMCHFKMKMLKRIVLWFPS